MRVDEDPHENVEHRHHLRAVLDIAAHRSQVGRPGYKRRGNLYLRGVRSLSNNAPRETRAVHEFWRGVKLWRLGAKTTAGFHACVLVCATFGDFGVFAVVACVSCVRVIAYCGGVWMSS